jgi:hypothetical protein
MIEEHEGPRIDLLKTLADMGEEPAFIARGRAPGVALEAFLRSCEKTRHTMLAWPRFHFANLRQRVHGDWTSLAHLLSETDAAHMLETLDAALPSAKLRPISLLTTDKRMLVTFLNSARRFNRNWQRYLRSLDLEPVNRPRHDYNQYYLIETACAFGHERSAVGFEPLGMIDHDYIEARFGPLKLPTLRSHLLGRRLFFSSRAEPD